MREHVELGMLLSRYGELLTERQRTLLSLSVDEDLSLSEIAEQAGISRQGVLDAIKRAESQLYTFEAVLGMKKQTDTIREKVLALAALPTVAEDAAASTLAREILEIVDDGI
ncbi:MAG: winged helix-turn-helix transcriptional regulator [Clostridia bacterium]|nr:sigma factor-like helix-turn-helix DNA-binding protein [Candidatus Pelethousia sp.]NCB30877.1 winged helix-turn-helix transcriptional regulator [Clostridia bacterium]